MRRIGAVAGVLCAVTVVVAGCGAKSEGKAVSREAVAVEAAVVGSGELQETIDVVGTLNPKFVAEIKSEVSGQVTQVRVTEWVKVTRGTVLATLDSREATSGLDAARAALAQAQVSEDRAVRELERVIGLKKAGLATAQNVDDATSAREAAAAVITATKAQVSGAETYLTKSTVVSPMDGVVAFRGGSPGDRGENMGGGPMFRIVDNRVLDLTVTVPSSRSSQLAVGEKLTFTADAMPGRSFEGTVRFINPAFDAASRTVSVTAEVINDKGELRGGQFVKGSIVLGSRSGVLRVPREALLTWDVAAKTGEVLVVSGETVVRRSVALGLPMHDDIEVTSGLVAGERVVTRGGFNVRPGDPVKVVAPEGA
jgi:membrane fusion protein, multidrug efflux system